MTSPGADLAARAEQARARFDRPDLAPLWRAIRHRLERAAGPAARVTVGPLSTAERAAIADLLGLRALPGETAQVRLDRLDRVLLASPAGLDSRGVVEAIGGPIADLSSARRADRAARQALWDWLASHPTVAAAPALAAWVEQVRAGGLVERSVERTRTLLTTALRALDALPADGRPLPAFASDLCGDPHALDDGRRLGGYVLRALACLRGEPSPDTAEQRRLLWEGAGVACDALSTTVLVAGLRPAGPGTLAATLRAWSSAGHATQVTLAQLRASPLGMVPHQCVWVVENPSVVAAALARFGAGCPPIACTSGWPNTAVIELLRQLAAGGAGLAYHGDLDGEGLRIAAYVVAKTGARPWRMTTADYAAARADLGPPAGRVTDVPWDPDLGPALRANGVAVPEEAVLGTLLDQMAQVA